MQYVKRIEEILKDFPKVKIRSSEVKNFKMAQALMPKLMKNLKNIRFFLKRIF